jgi:hypothetical protein
MRQVPLGKGWSALLNLHIVNVHVPAAPTQAAARQPPTARAAHAPKAHRAAHSSRRAVSERAPAALPNPLCSLQQSTGASLCTCHCTLHAAPQVRTTLLPWCGYAPPHPRLPVVCPTGALPPTCSRYSSDQRSLTDHTQSGPGRKIRQRCCQTAAGASAARRRYTFGRRWRRCVVLPTPGLTIAAQ